MADAAGQFPAETIVISPFANERVREWPLENFRRLIRLIVRDRRRRVVIVGTRAQRVRANQLVREFPACQVINSCGQLSWSKLEQTLDAAACVIANNSGIAHVASGRGLWTLCIFAASHAWVEWMPRGPRVVVVTRRTRCAPCEIGGDLCPNGIACMDDLEPQVIHDCLQDILVRRGELPMPSRSMPGLVAGNVSTHAAGA